MTPAAATTPGSVPSGKVGLRSWIFPHKTKPLGVGIQNLPSTSGCTSRLGSGGSGGVVCLGNRIRNKPWRLWCGRTGPGQPPLFHPRNVTESQMTQNYNGTHFQPCWQKTRRRLPGIFVQSRPCPGTVPPSLAAPCPRLGQGDNPSAWWQPGCGRGCSSMSCRIEGTFQGMH